MSSSFSDAVGSVDVQFGGCVVCSYTSAGTSVVLWCRIAVLSQVRALFPLLCFSVSVHVRDAMFAMFAMRCLRHWVQKATGGSHAAWTEDGALLLGCFLWLSLLCTAPVLLLLCSCSALPDTTHIPDSPCIHVPLGPEPATSSWWAPVTLCQPSELSMLGSDCAGG